jgi:hypothetical protein
MARDDSDEQPTPKVTYYAKVGDAATRERPKGLVRRIHTEPVPTDEALRRDLRWHPTEFLRRHWLGKEYDDPVEISEQEAEAIIARWREEFGTPEHEDER